MAELLPCPFCGTDNVVLESYKARKGYEAYVQCNGGCMANQHTITYDTLEEAENEAVKMWNTRSKFHMAEYQPTIQDLKRVQYLNKEIETLSEILNKIKSGSMVGAKSYRDTEPAPRYKDYPKFEKVTLEVESLETEIANRMVELHILYRQILHWIFSIDDALIRLIFEEKYLNCRTWNQVADRVGGANTEDSVKKMAYRYLEKELIE